MLNDSCLEFIFKQIFDQESSMITRKQASKLLCGLINRIDIPDNESDEDRIVDEEDQQIIVEMIRNIGNFERVLRSLEGNIKTAFKCEIPCIGESKIRIIEILACAVRIPSAHFNNELAQSEIIPLITVCTT